MDVKVKVTFKNQNFLEAIECAGYKSVLQFAEDVEICYGTLIKYLNFQAYPKSKRVIACLEETLHVSEDYLFPPEYKMAVDNKMGRPVHAIQTVSIEQIPKASPDFMLLPYDDSEELKEAIDRTLSTLDDRERKIIEGRFGFGDGRVKTLREIGEGLTRGDSKKGVQQERVRQMESKALRKLRHPTRCHPLKEFATGRDLDRDELIKSMAKRIKKSIRKVMFERVKKGEALSGCRKEIFDEARKKIRYKKVWWMTDDELFNSPLVRVTAEKEIDDYINFRRRKS